MNADDADQKIRKSFLICVYPRLISCVEEIRGRIVSEGDERADSWASRADVVGVRRRGCRTKQNHHRATRSGNVPRHARHARAAFRKQNQSAALRQSHKLSDTHSTTTSQTRAL